MAILLLLIGIAIGCTLFLGRRKWKRQVDAEAAKEEVIAQAMQLYGTLKELQRPKVPEPKAPDPDPITEPYFTSLDEPPSGSVSGCVMLALPEEPPVIKEIVTKPPKPRRSKKKKQIKTKSKGRQRVRKKGR